MGQPIQIKSQEQIIQAELKDTGLGLQIYAILPLIVEAQTWGKEVYFQIPVNSAIQNPVKEVEKGDIAYWPDGRCLCLFFGPTPGSLGEKPVPASPVEVVGKITSDLKALENIPPGERLNLEPL